MYDMDGIMNNIVVWDALDDHIITDPSGYTVDPGYTLNIPNLNYQTGNPAEFVVEFALPGNRIDVFGTLLTNSAPPGPPQYTAFTGGDPIFGWDGIYFHPGSQGNISDVLILNSLNGIVMEPGSTLLEPGVEGSRFEEIHGTGMTMDLAMGYTNINDTSFYSLLGPVARGKGLEISHGELNITNSYFNSHGPILPSLHITNADVSIDNVQFAGNNQQGNGVLVEGMSNGTVLNDCDFLGGPANDHYIRVDGSSILINNNTFYTGSGQLSVIANDDSLGVPAAPVLRNPNPPGTTFDNSTINALGSSSVTLQWGLLVKVIDYQSNPLPNSQVWVVDRNANPADPSTDITDSQGQAGFWVIELIQYDGYRGIFNPFNISAEHNSIWGYADAENSTVTHSRISIVVIGGDPIPNTPPIVSYIETPVGVQSGLVSINYILMDPDPGDDGYLSIEVYFSTDNTTWYPATISPVSDPISSLMNNTMYVFVWDSAGPDDLPGIYNETVRIKIIPYDRQGPGTPGITGPFTVNNGPPPPPSPPIGLRAQLSPSAVEDIEIIWNASADDGGGDNDVVGYTIYKSSTGINGTYAFAAWIPADGSSSYLWIDYGAGDGDWNNYFYKVLANDSLDTEEQNTQRAGKFAHSLELKWNVFSVPLIQAETSEDYVLRTIQGNYLILQGYHAGKSRPWLHKHVKKPKDMNNEIPIDHKSGYYIRMTASDHLVTAGSVPSGVDISLNAGWNLVGYPCLESKTVSEALSSISGSYNKVEFFNTTTQNEERLDPTDLMHPGQGYWIHATVDCVWEVPI
jgi:hypothetical protein